MSVPPFFLKGGSYGAEIGRPFRNWPPIPAGRSHTHRRNGAAFSLRRHDFDKAYDFDDQLLIYAQKPDATACADMSTWNNKMRRWVNAGSTAIALIRKGYGGKPYLDYVHDVADTHPVRGGKDPWLLEIDGGKTASRS